ncbi:MAG: metal-dependent hydrolase [Bacilli bacterium]|nr:metal-dependent hydrolase [Bacilli bacterium]
MMKGFMGRTHALLSILLMCLCMIIPLDIFKETFWQLKNNVLLFIVGLIVTVGGALLPDLDNSQSSAGCTLGPLGSICTIFMQSISSIIWTLYHGRNDKPPINQHRYFWHTTIVGIGFICLFWFGLPQEDTTIISTIKEYGDILGFLQDNVSLLFFILIMFMAVLCGSDMILNKIIKKFNIPIIVNYIIPLLIFIYTFTISFSDLRLLGICIGFGYLFHCIEDFFADTGCPLLFPIPIRNQVWRRCHFPITCQTGGIINTIIDIVALAIDILLIVFVFMGGN